MAELARNLQPEARPAILVVEDSAVEAELLRRTLARAGYAVSVAENGEEGLQAARAHRPALVMSDINMPVMNGYQLCRAMKHDDELWNIPLILHTVLSEPEDIIEAINSGADAYIIKPFAEIQLLARIRSLLRAPIMRRHADERRKDVLDYGGKRYVITGGGQQIMNLLASLYENMLNQNRKLLATQAQFSELNESLDRQIRERTAALMESEQRYRSIFADARDGIVLIDAESGLVADCNPEFEKQCGRALTELKNLHIWELRPPDLRCAARRKFEEILGAGEGGSSGLDYERPDGTRVPIEFVSRRVHIGSRDYLQSITRDITERKRAEQALRESEEKYRTLFESIDEGFCVIEVLFDEDEKPVDYRFLIVNPAFERQTGISNAVGRRVREFAPLHEEHWFEIYGKIALTGEPMRFENPAEQLHRYYEVYACRIGAPAERKVAVIFNDITERRQAEEALRLANERFQRFVDSNIVGILIATPAGDVIEANDYYLNLIGCTRQELEQGQVNWRAITPPEWLPADDRAIRELRERGVCTPYEKEYVRRDGSRVPVFLADTMLPGPSEQIAAFCLDLTERKAATERINFLAHYDELTGLPKRALLQDRWEMALATAERNRWRVALLFLDLDRFKNINDSLGHAIGDQLLKAVASRLKACLRREDTLARTGGDEFIVVLSSLHMAEEASEAARKLRDALQAPFRIDGHDLYVTVSVGISLYPDDGADFEALSRSADTALYQAKESGRDRFQFFTAELDALAHQRLQMENALRRALAHEEFELYYQPQWDMVKNRIIGLEALLRWRDPERGWLAPAEFIPLAEKNHLILPLGEWVLRTACRQNRLWQADGLRSLPVAVNISSLQFSQPTFSQVVAQALNETGLQPEYLELELTESILMESAETTIATVHALKDMGLRLAIDDFGTGYSSLSYLKRLPIDKLKIDRSFVRDIATDPNDVMIVRAIIGLAGSLQLQVLAEGVETHEQCQFLREEQCPEAQGYHFSKPLPADQVEALLRRYG